MAKHELEIEIKLTPYSYIIGFYGHALTAKEIKRAAIDVHDEWRRCGGRKDAKEIADGIVKKIQDSRKA